MQQNIDLIELDKHDSLHLEILYIVRSHPEVDRYLRGTPPANFSAHVNYLQNISPHKRFYLVQTNDSFCGYCQLTISENHVEVGMALHPDYCNKGIGSKALSSLLERIRQDNEIKNKPLILYVKKDNLRAIALYTKQGFKRIGAENEYGEYLMEKRTDHD